MPGRLAIDAQCRPGPFAPRRRTGLPAQAGIGFKPQHFDALIADADAPAFIEVHAENYLGAGGLPHQQLTRLRERLPLSLHGVGLSLGGEAPPDPSHLRRLAALVARYQPASFSEHLAWSTHGGHFFNDLLPVCYDRPTLERVCAHLDAVQDALGMRILLENPSSYFRYRRSTMDECQFLRAIVQRTGCGLLLDLNNLYVSCHNNGGDPRAGLHALPLPAIGEIHLAGHARQCDADGHPLLVDDHGGPVADAVWQLYAELLARTGPLPTLIEWDADVPAYERLAGQARQAQSMLQSAMQPLAEATA